MLTRTLRPQLAEQYTDMLAQDYRLRNALLSSYHHDFSDLMQFDQRMQTYLDGMLLLKEETAEYLRGLLKELLSPGELFAVAIFAANTDDEFLLSGCLGLVQALPRLLPALYSVINWMPAQSNLWPLVSSLPAFRAYAAATRNDNGQTASVIFNQQDIQGIIEQGRCVDFLLNILCQSTSPFFVPALETVFSSDQDNLVLQGCRAILCSNLALDEYTNAAVMHLRRLTYSKKTDIRASAVKYLLASQTEASRTLISRLDEEPADTRLLIQAMGWSGQTKYIPSLMAYFDMPEYARLSALSVISITGSLPEQDGWQCKKEEINISVKSESADIPESDPEQGVCWPQRKAFDNWWKIHRGDFSLDTQHLCGQPTTQEGLSAVLKDGYLNLRSLALMRMGVFSERATLPALSQV